MKFNKSFAIVHTFTNLHLTMKFQQIIENNNKTSKLKNTLWIHQSISKKCIPDLPIHKSKNPF